MTFEYITTQEQLSECITKINSVPEIAVDLEFDKNRYRYGFNLCLLQIKAADEIFLIDPLGADFDIKPIFEPLENPKIEKVVYAFGEDIRLLHTLGCYPKNLFDIVIQIGGFNQFRNKKKSLEEMHRVAKNLGTIFICD